MIEANNPSLKSWIEIEENSDFPIQNLPFGIYSTKKKSKRVGIAIGDKIIDLQELANAGLLDSTGVSTNVFEQEFLNPFMELGKDATRKVRNKVSQLLRASNTDIKGQEGLTKKVIDNQSDAIMHLPVKIGDYTDFYSSKEHATNVGTMFRDPDNALLPNWLYIPVGYHGRASSIITTEQAIVRPKGQQKPKDDEPPTFGPCKLLDFELEMAFITYNGKPLGESIDADEAEDFMFGMCLFNDWSARDIQKWEYVPLGPFLAKNFASSMSPWIVTMDALEPFRCETPAQNPKPFEYLQYSGKKSFDIKLEMYIQPENGEENCVSKSNYKHMYWNQSQQLAHHSVNGCNIMCGDLMGSGTISGPTPDSYGSMLELSWKGTKPITLSDGSERKFLLDGDTVIERGYCQNESVRVGFGEVRTKILPAN